MLFACGADDGTTDEVGGGSGDRPRLVNVPFRAFDDCEELVNWTKAEMLDRVGPYGLDGGGYPYPVFTEDAVSAPGETPADGRGDENTVDTGSGTGSSETNVQEIGVDEGDISETDGRFVYSIVDQRLRSVDLRTSKVLSNIDLSAGRSEMMLFDDRLVVATESWTGANETVIDVFDVDEGELRFLRRDHLEGHLVALRGVGSTAHVVMRSSFVDHLDFVYPVDDREESLDAAERRNIEIVESLEAGDLLPRRFPEGEFGSRGAIEPAIECERLGRPTEFSGWGVTWVANVDTTRTPEPPLGAGGMVADSDVAYVTSESLYITSTQWDTGGDEPYRPSNPEPPHTNIHVFDVSTDDGDVDYLASGVVEGTVLNSYALSEHEGHLRIATTAWRDGFGGGQDNGVHVFARDNDVLVERGSVRGLGRGEQIQGVRFDGSRGYVVTFRQIDPLYVLDLSDPTAPSLVGELKIPGYSTYLKPIDGDRVIGVGLKGTDTGLSGGVQVSLFDVSDPARPTLVSTADIGGWSNAVYDPHAFLWWSETSQLIVPKDIECDSSNTDGCESAVVLVLDGDSFVEQGRLFQWYPIQRSLIAERRLVTVSSGGVMVNDLTTLEQIDYVEYDLPWTVEDESER